jgi:hypothetical protein
MTTTFRGSICTLAAALTMTVALHGQTLNTIFNFEHGKTGYHPIGSLSIDANGNLYGTTQRGGVPDLGVAYELVPPASPGGAWTELVLHSFTGIKGDGSPSAGLVIGPTGSLCGVTNGPSNAGSVFRLTPPAAANAHWRETVLHTFTDSNGDGATPTAAPTLGPHGVRYGATSAGGTTSSGIVYALSPPISKAGPWTEQVLHTFTGGSDGEQPAGPLALGADGTIYGATSYGGGGLGVIFELAPPKT